MVKPEGRCVLFLFVFIRQNVNTCVFSPLQQHNTLVVALMSAVDDATLPCESRCVVVVIVIPGNTITASKDLAQASYFLATNRLLGYSIKYNQQYLYTCDEPQKVMNFTLQNELMILRSVMPKFQFSEKFFDGFIYWNSKCILHCWTCNV